MLAVLAVIALACIGVVAVLETGASPCRDLGTGSPTARPPAVGGRPPVTERLRRVFRPDRGDAVYCHDFADPFVLRAGSRYYAYATNTGGDNIPVLYGAGPLDTQHETDALPRVARWARTGEVWAPSVIVTRRGYLMYYSATRRSDGEHCLSVARAANPVGPFLDSSTQPLRCNAIDPRPVITRSGAYLLWAQGGIYGARLGSNLRSLAGPAFELVHATQRWQAGIVEGPSMLPVGGRFVLFFSANRFATAAYAIGYARCATPLGPCTAASRPMLTSSDGIAGPGGQDFFTDTHGRLWMIFHAWRRNAVGYPFGVRYAFAVPVNLDRRTPRVSVGAG